MLRIGRECSQGRVSERVLHERAYLVRYVCIVLVCGVCPRAARIRVLVGMIGRRRTSTARVRKKPTWNDQGDRDEEEANDGGGVFSSGSGTESDGSTVAHSFHSAWKAEPSLVSSQDVGARRSVESAHRIVHIIDGRPSSGTGRPWAHSGANAPKQPGFLPGQLHRRR